MATIPAPREADPVVVVGAGPVGQTTALLLARWGLRVLLVDERPHRTLVGSRAICQQRDVLDIWESVGAGRRIADAGVTWTRARSFYRDREVDSWAFVDRGRSPLPPFVNVSQAVTEQVLDERIAASPLIDVRWDCRVVRIEQDAESVMLTCAGPHGESRLRAPYVVACCGARGDALRHALGVTFDGESFDDRFLICDIRASLTWSGERRFHFDPDWNPGRQVLIHACPDSVFRIDWQVPEDFDLAGEERTGALDRRIRAIVGDVDYEVVWRSVYRFHSRVASRLRIGRVLLAGDFAHLLAPFGARGLNSGVADAENAAWKIAYAMHGWAGDALLDSYHAERHAAAVENLDVTTQTMRFLVPRTEHDRRRRTEILEAATVHQEGRTGIDSGRFAEPFWYVDSPLTTPASGRPWTGRPSLGAAPRPAPGVLLPDARIRLGDEETWLRGIARDGFLVLATNDDTVRAAEAAAAHAAPVPVRIEHVDAIDAYGDLREALEPATGEAWVIRPDAHIAAVLTDPVGSDIADAVARALGSASLRDTSAQSR